MPSERARIQQGRAANPRPRAARLLPVAMVLGCFLTAARGQWLEKTIALSDTFGDVWPAAIYYVASSNCVYVAGEDGVVVVDATTNARVARLDMDEPMFMAFDSHDNKVYMSGSESLSVIDPMMHRVLAQLRVGSNPTRLCYNPTANKVYCLTGSRRDTVAVVDCSTDSLLARIWVGRTDYDLASVCCNPDGNKVYIPSAEEGTIAVIDGAGDSLLRSLDAGDYPTALAYSRVSNKLYCAVSRDGEVAVYDAGPDTLLRLIEVGTWPLALGYSPVSNKVYSGNENGVVDVIDCGTDTVLASIDLAINDPMFFLFDSIDNRIFCFSDYYSSIPAISCSGDTIAGWVEFHGDVYNPDPACYSPQQNRLYIRGRSSADVGVVDPASCEVETALPMTSAPLLGCYASPRDRLYCSDEESGLISVINCSTDSMERRIFTPGSHLCSPVYSSGSGKLYYGAWLGNGCALQVVDCARDSFEAALPLNFDAVPAIVYNPAMDRIYWAGNLGESTVVVVDCAGDSVVAKVPVGQHPCGLACNPDSNRVYCASFAGDSMFVSAIDCATDSVIGSVFVSQGYYYGPEVMCYVPSRDVVVSTTPDNALVVVDGKAQQLLQTVLLGGKPSQFTLDDAASKLYCFIGGSSDLGVIDTRDMSVKATIRLAADLDDMAFDSIANRVWATSPDHRCISLVDGRANRFLGLFDAGQSPGDITWVPQHRSMYVVDQRGQAILVVRDTSLAGVYENPASLSFRSLPTLVRGTLFLPKASSRKPQAATLLDATGRNVMKLQPGANDVRALAPGVYFVCDVAGGKRSAAGVRKVIVTR